MVISRGVGTWEQDGRSPKLHELWRAGGFREGEELAVPVGAAASPSGRLAIADFALSEVAVLEADGLWLGPWGTPGDGPGELSSAVAVNWDRRDGSLAVFDLTRAKVVFLREGAPVREDVSVTPVPLARIFNSGAFQWAGIQPSGGAVVQPAPTADDLEPEQSLSVILYLGPSEQPEDTLASSRGPSLGGSTPYASLAAPGWPHLVAAVGTDGSIALGGGDSQYRVSVLDSLAQPTLVICRDAPPVPLSEREVEVRSDSEIAEELQTDLREAIRPDSLAPYGRLFFGARGRLWVQRDRPAAFGFRDALLGVPGARYDVFGWDGQYLGEVQAPERARLQTAAGDTVWSFEIGDLDETEVVAYSLRWEPR